MGKKSGSNKGNQGGGSKPTHLDGRTDAGVAEAGTIDGGEAADIVEEALEASDNLEDGADGAQTEEVASEDVTEARKKDVADRSPATVQPTTDNDNMLNDKDHGLTPGMRANLDEDDPRKADPADIEGANRILNDNAADELPHATARDLTSVLAVDDEATEEMDLDAVAKAVKLPRGRILDFSVRSGRHGKVLTAVDVNGKKHSVNV